MFFWLQANGDDMKTLRERIEIEQAGLDGKNISRRAINVDGTIIGIWEIIIDTDEHVYEWTRYDYRIKPEPRVIYVPMLSDGHVSNSHDVLYDPTYFDQQGILYKKFIEVIDEN